MSEPISRPSIKRIIEAVADEFDVTEAFLMSFERKASPAKFAVALLAREHCYTMSAIGQVLGRDHSTICSAALSAKAMMMKDKGYAFMIEEVRKALAEGRPRRKPVPPPPPTAEEIYLQKLEQHKAEILRLRNLNGPDRGWSDKSLSRRFGIPVEFIAPVIGVYRAERS